MKTIARLALLLTLVTLPLGAATTRNDDSCDVSVMPAATLLLPYFEVDVKSSTERALTTLFTIVNTTSTPQIAKVTLWTDWAHPVLDFPIYLTGYDVQAINLRDVLAGGSIAPTTNRGPIGSRSAVANPLFLPEAASACSTLPTSIPTTILGEIHLALMGGVTRACENIRIGGQHANAVGYATIDLVATCRPGVVTDAEYFNELLFDNVLTGDWQIVNPSAASGNFAAGSPLVHLRAIPEGGRAGEAAATNLPYTFYDRFAGASRPRFDRRQPLSSAFAARYIQGGGAGFNTNFIVWREGRSASGTSCPAYEQQNARMPLSTVRFDERENPTATFPCGIFLCPTPDVQLGAASSVSSNNAIFPPLTSGDTSGWMALNLDNGGSTNYSAAAGRDFRPGSSTTTGPRPSQNWVVPILVAEGRYSAAREATALANGCSPSPAIEGATFMIGPGPNPTP